MILPMIVGKLVAGITAVFVATFIANSVIKKEEVR